MSILSFLDYIQSEKNYSKHTITSYRSDLESFLRFSKKELNGNSLRDMTYGEIRSWIIFLVDSGISNRSINRKVSSLNSYYKFLQKIGAIEINPLIKHKALKTEKKILVPFSKIEITTVLDSIDITENFTSLRNRFIIELFYGTGIRRIELVDLKLKDFDAPNNIIKVLGKRNKERILPLLPIIKTTYYKYLEERNNMTSKDSQYLFLTSRGTKIYETLVYRIINEYFSKASTKIKCSPHVLRHSFATHLINEGADLNSVKELLGHTSLAATQVYTHSSISQLKKVYSNSHPRSKNNKE